MPRALIRIFLLLACLSSAKAACERDYFSPFFNLGYAVFQDQGQAPRGYVIDMLSALSKRSACKIALQAMPAERVRRSLDSMPLVVPSTASPELLSQGWTFIPMWHDHSYLIVRKELQLRSLVELGQRHDVVVGILHGGRYGASVDHLLGGIPSERLDISISLEDLFRKMAVKRVGATFASEDVYRWHLDRLPKSLPVDTFEVPEYTGVELGVMLNPKIISPADLKKLTATLVKLRDDGSFAAMMGRYLGPESAKRYQWVAPRRAKSPQLP